MTRSNITITHGIVASFGLFVLFSTPASAASPLSYDAVEDARDRELEENFDEADLDEEDEEDLEANEQENDAVEDDDQDAEDEDEDELEDADGVPSSYRAKPDTMAAREAQSGGCSVNPRDSAPGMAVLALLGLLGLRRRSRHSLAA